MKLTDKQVRIVEEQVGVKALPEEHPVVENLKDAFGDHTFFLDAAGLNVVEPFPDQGSTQGTVVKIASWTNDERNELAGHEPEVLSITIDLSAS